MSGCLKEYRRASTTNDDDPAREASQFHARTRLPDVKREAAEICDRHEISLALDGRCGRVCRSRLTERASAAAVSTLSILVPSIAALRDDFERDSNYWAA